jgi:dTDP-4-dehydrorhamnose reductase
MNILLLGHTGQVGWELQRALAPLGHVITCGRHPTSDLALDLGLDLTPGHLANVVDRAQPQLIVNAAAYTAVDRAESEPELARLMNTTLPCVLADRARALGVPLVHYSTDYVFDGSGSHARTETEATGPLNVYGHTKLAGEEGIRASGCTHLILRTSWVYAARGDNFARTMLRLAAEQKTLQVINDQVGAPTGADLLADITAHACRQLLANSSLSGTYHCSAAGATTWFDYACWVLTRAKERAKERAQAQGHSLEAAPGAVQAVTSGAYAAAAQRPLNSRLCCQLLQQTFGVHLPAWQTGVDRLLAEILGG